MTFIRACFCMCVRVTLSRMGNNLFGANISGKLLAAVGPKVLAAKLRRRAATTRDPVHPSLGLQRADPVEYSGLRGFVDSFAAYLVGKSISSSGPGTDTVIQAGDRQVSIFADSIPAAAGDPQAADEIFIEAKWISVIAILERDPDRALFTLQCR